MNCRDSALTLTTLLRTPSSAFRLSQLSNTLCARSSLSPNVAYTATRWLPENGGGAGALGLPGLPGARHANPFSPPRTAGSGMIALQPRKFSIVVDALYCGPCHFSGARRPLVVNTLAFDKHESATEYVVYTGTHAKSGEPESSCTEAGTVSRGQRANFVVSVLEVRSARRDSITVPSDIGSIPA